MRLILDTLVALMLLGVLAGLLWQQRAERVQLSRIEHVQQSILAIESQALYHGAVGDVESTAQGYSQRIEAAWFHPRPENVLLEMGGQRWLERAGEADQNLFNPRHIVGGGERAAFWYNPTRGLVRARVPMQLSHRATVELYNLVNGTSLRVEDVEWSPAEMEGEVQRVAQKGGGPGAGVPGGPGVGVGSELDGATRGVLRDFGGG